MMVNTYQTRKCGCISVVRHKITIRSDNQASIHHCHHDVHCTRGVAITFPPSLEVPTISDPDIFRRTPSPVVGLHGRVRLSRAIKASIQVSYYACHTNTNHSLIRKTCHY